MPRARASYTTEKKITCVINPHAAGKKWKRNRLLRTYIKKNFFGQLIESYENKAHTIHEVERLAEDHEIIVAAGGDGTIADVIQGIIGSRKGKEVTLGIIPLGSGNAFRKSLGIPKSVKKSIRIIAEGKTREIDLIDIGGRLGTFASIGATAEVTLKKFQNNIPGLLGHLKAATIMFKLPRQEQEIELLDGIDDTGERFDRKILRLRVFDCTIGKTNHFGYNWKVAPMAKIDDGYIDLTFFEISGWKYLFHFPAIYIGTFQKTQKHFKAKKVIFRGKNLHVQYHGEPLGVKDEIELKVIPRALRVISPV